MWLSGSDFWLNLLGAGSCSAWIPALVAMFYEAPAQTDKASLLSHCVP